MARKPARGRSRKRWEAIRAHVFGLLQEGAPVSAVAEEVHVTTATIRKWQRHWAAVCTTSLATSAVEGETVSALLRREAPAVARVILDQAKNGDARAAALVMKLLGDELDLSEADDARRRGAVSEELARELDGLPASTAYEIMGLLEGADSAAAGGDARPGKRTAEGKVGPGRLPWQKNDPPPDEGGDSL